MKNEGKEGKEREEKRKETRRVIGKEKWRERKEK